MGDTNNNPNGGNEFDNTPLTPDNQESTDFNPNDSFRQGFESKTEPTTYEKAPDEQSSYEQTSYEQPSYEQSSYSQSSEEQPSYERAPYEQSYETTTEPVSPKKPKTKLIAAVVIAVIILGGAIFALTNGSLANTIALMTKSPAEYYSSIEKQGINEGVDALTASYEKYLDLYKQQKNTGIAQDADVKITVNPQFTSMLGLTDFQSIEAKISTLSKGTNEKTTMGLSYNNQALVTFNALLNSENSELYLNVPELSSAYLLYSLDDLMSYTGESMYGYDSREYTKKIEELITSDAVTPQVLNTMLKKYSSIIVDNLTNVKLEKNVSITASDSKDNYNKLTAEITEKDFQTMISAILKEAKNDEDLKNLLVALEVCTKDEYADLVDNAIKEIEDDTDISTDDPVYMNVYVDKNGKIMGREFTSSEKDATGGGYYLVVKGAKVGLTGWVKENGNNIVDFSADGSVSNNGFNGKIVTNFTDSEDNTTYTFNVDVENAKQVTDTGYLNGKFTISSPLLMGAGLVLDCKGDDKEQNMKFQVTYGGMEAATIDITGKKGEYKEFELPPTDGEVYDGINDIYSYMGAADFEGLLNRVQDVTGLDLSSILQSYLSNSSY
jgi:hypothetical protein